MNNYLKAKFQNYANENEAISSVAFEQLLKSLGIKISRRQINRLARLKNIRSPVKRNGLSPKGNRLNYDFISFVDILALKLVECCVETQGANNSAKFDIFDFAKERLETFDECEESIEGFAWRTALFGASNFSKDGLYGAKLLENIKKINLAIKQTIHLWYLANTMLYKNGHDYSIVKVWSSTKEYAFNGTVLGKFAKELTQFNKEDGSKNFLDPTRFNSLNKEQRESLKCWCEIMMAFRPAKLIVAEIARTYMMVKFGIDVDLNVSAMNLLALNRYLS